MNKLIIHFIAWNSFSWFVNRDLAPEADYGQTGFDLSLFIRSSMSIVSQIHDKLRICYGWSYDLLLTCVIVRGHPVLQSGSKPKLLCFELYQELIEWAWEHSTTFLQCN